LGAAPHRQERSLLRDRSFINLITIKFNKPTRRRRRRRRRRRSSSSSSSSCCFFCRKQTHAANPNKNEMVTMRIMCVGISIYRGPAERTKEMITDDTSEWYKAR
jgi:hypothetical protein